MKRASILLIAILASILAAATQAKLFSDKGICVPSYLTVTTLAKENESCASITTRCAQPYECHPTELTCQLQKLYPDKDCTNDSDCYAFPSVVSQTSPGGLRCMGTKCRWIRGVDDECEVNDQCPPGVTCREKKCSKRRGDGCVPILDELTDACGRDMYCKGVTCQPKLDNGNTCLTGLECRSGLCFSGNCVAEQRSEGASCYRNILLSLDNCASGLFCDGSGTTGKCKSYGDVGATCSFTLTDKSKMCKLGLLCKDNKCVKPSDVPCADLSDCGTIFQGVCMCKTGKCAALYDPTTCGAQLAKATTCLLLKCRQVINPYVFADDKSCAKRQCMHELSNWHDCHKTVTKREYLVTESYMGDASVARYSTVLLVALSVIVSFFSL